MNARQISDALQTIIKDLHRKSAPTDTTSMRDALLGYADSHNLAPAQLEKMGTQLNVQLALAHAKQAAPDARGESFDLVDVPALVERYTDPGRSGASKQARDTYSDANGGIVIQNSDWQPYTVGGHFGGAVSFDWAKVDDDYEKGRFNWAKQKAASESEPNHLASRHAARMNAGQLQDMEEDFKKQARQELRKVADLVDRHPELYPEIVQDVEAHMQDKAAGILETFDKILNSRRITLPPVPTDSRDFFSDRHGVLDAFGKAASCMLDACAAQDLREEYEEAAQTKIAASGTDKDTDKKKHKAEAVARPFETPAMGLPSYLERPSSKEDEADGGTGQALQAARLGGQALNWGLRAPGESLERARGLAHDAVAPDTAQYMADNYSRLFGHAHENTNQRLENSFQRWQQAAVLHRLMMSDDVIRRANPAHVVAAFDTIRHASPSVARDLSTARILLREAVQYQGVPLQAVETLRKIDKPEPAKK